jgi:hypothetical protein
MRRWVWVRFGVHKLPPFQNGRSIRFQMSPIGPRPCLWRKERGLGGFAKESKPNTI